MNDAIRDAWGRLWARWDASGPHDYIRGAHLGDGMRVLDRERVEHLCDRLREEMSEPGAWCDLDTAMRRMEGDDANQ